MRRPITKSQRLSSITRVSYYQSLHFWAVKGFGVANISKKKPCCLNILLLHGRTATDSFSKNLLLLRFVAGSNWSGSHEWSGREKSDIAAEITWYDYLLVVFYLINYSCLSIFDRWGGRSTVPGPGSRKANLLMVADPKLKNICFAPEIHPSPCPSFWDLNVYHKLSIISLQHHTVHFLVSWYREGYRY